MALSYIDYLGDGTQTTFVSKPYLKEEHVTVHVDGVSQPTNAYSISGTAVTLNTPPIAGTSVRIGRNTSQEERLHDYSNASLLTADEMDADANQLFFLTQEAFDTANETNVAGAKFYTAQASVPANPNVGDLWYDVNTGQLKIYSGTEWGLAVPLSSTSKFETFETEGNYSFVAVPDVSTKALVFLNGVKQVQTYTKANVLAAATDPDDYYVDTANNRIYFATLVAGSVVEVVLSVNTGGGAGASTTVTGGGSVAITQNPLTGVFTITDSDNNLSFVVADENNGSVPIPTITDNGLNAEGMRTYTIDNGAGQAITWSDGASGASPTLGVDYFNGTDGSFKSFIYKVAATQPETPIGGQFNGSSEVFPATWYDTPSVVGSSADIEWVSTARYVQTNGVWANNGWSVPAKHYQRGSDGAAGTSITVKGTFATVNSLTGLVGVLGDSYIIGNDLYVCTTASVSTVLGDFTNAGQFVGTNGVNSYIHYAYANFTGGVISDFSTSVPTNRDYLGIYTDSNVADSALSSAYTWQLVKGADGTTVAWKGTYANRAAFEAANTPLANGMSYYDSESTHKKSYIYQDGQYYQVAADGVSGTDGVDGMVWKGESASPPAIPYVDGSTTVLDHAAATNWAYKDTTEGDGKVYIYNSSTQAWEIMVENGTNGNHGEDGVDGTDGLNVYFCYHNSPVGTEPTKPHNSFIAYIGSLLSSDYPSNGWTQLASDDSNWMCQKTGLSNSDLGDDWSDPIRISGFNGTDGNNGVNGAGQFSGDMTVADPIGSATFSAARADYIILQAGARLPVIGDVITLSENGNRANTVTKICTAVSSAGVGTYGDDVELFIDGSLVVDGTIVGSKILAGTIDSNHIAVGTLDADRIKVNTLDVGGAAIDGSLGIINGTAGNDVYMPFFPELFGATWVNYNPYHVRSSGVTGVGIPLGAEDTVANHSPNGNTPVVPLMEYSFTTYDFAGTAPFIVQVGLDPLGDFRTTSEVTFAFAMKATESNIDYFSTDPADYVTTRGCHNKGLAATGTVNMSDIVTLSGNTTYHIWVFGAMEDVAVITSNNDGDIISRGIRDGFITVTGLNA